MRIRTDAVLSLGLVLQVAHAGAQEITSGKWQTKITNGKNEVVLYWTHVYEGRDTVYKIAITPETGRTTSLRVEGQPVFNSDKTIVALPNCADDGCSTEIGIVDLMSREKLPAVRVPETGQIYLDCTWRGSVLKVAVEVAQAGGMEPRQTTHEFTLTKR